MTARQFSADRVGFFSDGVFAVLITILVLELKPPHAAAFSALLPLWPTGLSYDADGARQPASAIRCRSLSGTASGR